MKKHDLLFLLVSSFILIVAWIGFNIYSSAVTSTISETLDLQIIPIPGSFDTDTIAKLKQRTMIAPIYEYLGAGSQSALLIPTPEIPSPDQTEVTASASAEDSTQTASDSQNQEDVSP